MYCWNFGPVRRTTKLRKINLSNLKLFLNVEDHLENIYFPLEMRKYEIKVLREALMPKYIVDLSSTGNMFDICERVIWY